jgi:hypothetical protein
MKSKDDQYIEAIKKWIPSIVPAGMEKYVIEYKKTFDRKLKEMLHGLFSDPRSKSSKSLLPSKIPFMDGYIRVDKELITRVKILDNGETKYFREGLGLGILSPLLKPNLHDIIAEFKSSSIVTREMYYLNLCYEDNYRPYFMLYSIGVDDPICMMVDGSWQCFYHTRSKNKFPTMDLSRFLRSFMEYNFVLFLGNVIDNRSVEEKIKRIIKADRVRNDPSLW